MPVKLRSCLARILSPQASHGDGRGVDVRRYSDVYNGARRALGWRHESSGWTPGRHEESGFRGQPLGALGKCRHQLKRAL